MDIEYAIEGKEKSTLHSVSYTDLKNLSYDGTSKSSEGKAQNIAYWDDYGPSTETVRQKALAEASPEAIAFLDPLNPKPPEKLDANTLTGAQWQDRRRYSVGSSEVSHISGENPYEGCTSYDLYNKKIGAKPLFSDSEKDAMKRQLLFDYGHFAETFLHSWVRSQWPHSKFIVDTNIYNPVGRTYMTANLDGMLQLPDGSWCHIEFKTANPKAKDNYKDGTIPMYYRRQLIQCQHILNVWVSYIIVMFNRDDIIALKYERDLDAEMEQVKMVDEFWTKNVLANIPPALVGPPKYVLKALRNYSGPSDPKAPEVVFPQNFFDDIQEIDKINRELTALNEKKKILEEQKQKLCIPLVSTLGSTTTAYVDNGCDQAFAITYKPEKPRVSIDKDLLEREYPDVYNQVVHIPAEGPRPVKIKPVKMRKP